MTPADLRTFLSRLGLSQVGAAKVVGIDPRTMRRYLAGELPVPKWLPLALKGARKAREAPLTVTGRMGGPLGTTALDAPAGGISPTTSGEEGGR